MGLNYIEKSKSIDINVPKVDYNQQKSNSNINNNKIEDISLDNIGIEYADIEHELVQTSFNNATITKGKEGDYNISVKTDINEKYYNLYDQGRGIGLSNYTHVKSLKGELREQISDRDLLMIKNKILYDCYTRGLSQERLCLLKELLNDKTFLTALNDFTIENGCGTYSLLTVLNGYYNKNINQIEFFTTFLITNLHEENENINDGFDDWLKIIFGKLNKQKSKIGEKEYNEFYDKLKNLDEGYKNEPEEFKNNLSKYLKEELEELKEEKIRGPLTISAMNKILNNLKLDNEILLDYDNTDFNNNGKYELLLKSQLSSGKPVILMTENKNDISFNEFSKKYGKIVDDEDDKYLKFIEENGQYDALTNSHHFITLLSMDENGKVLIADSRYLPDDEENGKDNNTYSHILEMNYNDLLKFIQNPKTSNDNSSNTYGKEKAGILFVNPYDNA